MKKNRTRYNEEFKAQVAMEALREQRTINEIAGQYQIHPNQVSKWKSQLIENAKILFEDGRTKKIDKDKEELESRLYQQIGQLQVELEWLKKKSGY
jgi:putative transposase